MKPARVCALLFREPSRSQPVEAALGGGRERGSDRHVLKGRGGDLRAHPLLRSRQARAAHHARAEAQGSWRGLARAVESRARERTVERVQRVRDREGQLRERPLATLSAHGVRWLRA
eukprot:3445529-Rhodomonas_salina.2